MFNRNRLALLLAGLAVVAVIGVSTYRFLDRDEAAGPHPPPSQPSVTFSEHIAPILFGHCAQCHRPGESGPFSLLSFDDARKRAGLIATVTASRYMPPWLPAPGEHRLMGERRLGDEQIALIQQWVEQGSAEGNPADLPPLPAFTRGWQLGEPDLVVEMPQSYTLAAEGTDVWRNFAIPVPTTSARWVKALELRPGNPRVVHHAFIQVDTSLASRRIDERDPQPGFGGMELGAAENPGGHLIGWTPGKVPFVDERMAWRLNPGSDLVLQLHLQPSGKPETVNAKIGLHFSDSPPTLQSHALLLRNDDIDIPAGATDHLVEDRLQLPVDVKVIGLYPHAHYLAKDIKAVAIAPDRKETILLHIPDWEFNWQDDYRYAEPIALAAGTTVAMRYRYDNSDENVRNPNNPPQRVRFGNRSSDEMATLALQVLPENAEHSARLEEALMRAHLQRNQDNWYAQTRLGVSLRRQGKLDLAIERFRKAVRIAPSNPTPYYSLGNALGAAGRFDEAIAAYRKVLAIAPDHPKAHNNLGIVLQFNGDLQSAELEYRQQLELSPLNAKAHHNLGNVLAEQTKTAEAISAYLRALELDPNAAQTQAYLADAYRETNRIDDAISGYRKALEFDGQLAHAHFGLGLAELERGDPQAATARLRTALDANADYAAKLNSISWRLATHSNANVRSPMRALLLAELANDATGHQSAEYLDTLGAAYAANGEYEKAQSVAEKVIELAKNSSASEYLDQFREHLALYRDRRPYISPASSN